MKKICGILLIAALIAGSGGPGLFSGSGQAHAGEKGGKDLENAIRAAKKVIDVPREYSEFTYFSHEQKHDGKKTVFWSLNWARPDKDGGGWISAAVSDTGVLTEYSFAPPEREEPWKGDYLKAKKQAQSVAETFLAKALGDYGASMRYDPRSEGYGPIVPYLREKDAGAAAESKTAAVAEKDDMMIPWDQNDIFYLTFRFYRNDVPVDFLGASVAVNLYGEVVSYDLYGNVWDLTEAFLSALPDTKGLISADAAKKACLEQDRIPLHYESSFDYETKKLSIFAAYGPQDRRTLIDAKTGKPVKAYYGYYDDYGPLRPEAASAAGNKDAEEDLTKEEQEAVDRIKGLLSESEADRAAREYFPSMGKMNSAHLYSSYLEPERYLWSVSYEKGNIRIDAKTAELIAFNSRQWSEGNEVRLTYDQAMEKAEAFLKKVASKKFEKTRHYDNRQEYKKQSDAAGGNGKLVPPDYASDYNLRYERLENGVIFKDNGLSVTVDRKTGDIRRYYCEWYDTAVFPSVQNAMSREKAFDIFAKELEFGLIYKKTGKGGVSLVYDFLDSKDMRIDPFSGKQIDHEGNPIGRTPSEYTDLKGNWAEKYVIGLQSKGYFFPGASEQFQPGKAVTQVEFLRYLYGPDQSYYKDEKKFYSMVTEHGVIKKEEINPQKTVERQEAAKFVARYLGYEKLASRPGLFRNVFKDKLDPGYEGYTAICYGLDIMGGDRQGRLNGKTAISRAETAKVLWQTLAQK